MNCISLTWCTQIKESLLKHGTGKQLAEESAASTVNKDRAQHGEAERVAYPPNVGTPRNTGRSTEPAPTAALVDFRSVERMSRPVFVIGF
ncbi:hypothetical protein [Dechloromonas sp. A34]|uniref:hypothetical protein n=1 Tax=Dechloromonas sp. A34 TaxID=447588 RepID=UPI0022496DCA|nr:hypothetical protein [Dechloromonas sp. A34]